MVSIKPQIEPYGAIATSDLTLTQLAEQTIQAALDYQGKLWRDGGRREQHYSMLRSALMRRLARIVEVPTPPCQHLRLQRSLLDGNLTCIDCGDVMGVAIA